MTPPDGTPQEPAGAPAQTVPPLHPALMVTPRPESVAPAAAPNGAPLVDPALMVTPRLITVPDAPAGGQRPLRVVIIGGGIGGLAAAWHLRRRVAESAITVVEAGPRFGGVIRSERRDGYLLEHGPDAFLRAKPAALALVNALGMGGDVQETEDNARRSLVVRHDRLHPVPEGFYLLAPGKWTTFIGAGLVSLPGMLRMGMDLFLPRRAAGAPEESLAQFVRRRLGSEALARLAQPLVGGIWTADPELLSMPAALPQLIAMEAKHRSLLLGMRARLGESPASGARYGLFAALRGGMGSLVDGLVASLTSNATDPASATTSRKADLRLLTTAVAVEPRRARPYADPARWQVALSGPQGQDTLLADAVIISLPAHAAAKVCASFDEDLAWELDGIPCASVAIVTFAWDAGGLRDYPVAAGLVVPHIEGRTVIAASFTARKFAGRAPEGGILVRAFIGGALHPHALDRDDQALITAALTDLDRWLGVRGPPRFAIVQRWPRAMPQYVLGHQQRLTSIRARERAWPGLALCGGAYEGVGIPDVIAQAERAVTQVCTASAT